MINTKLVSEKLTIVDYFSLLDMSLCSDYTTDEGDEDIEEEESLVWPTQNFSRNRAPLIRFRPEANGLKYQNKIQYICLFF